MAWNLNNTNNALLDDLGRYRTTSLFWEYRSPKYCSPWCLAEDDMEKDGVVVPSMQRIYLSYDHIPEHEYEFAMDMFGRWSHWLRLQESPEVMSHITKWREELNIKNKADNLKLLMKRAKDGDVSAAKYLTEGKFDGSISKRGRPTKEEVTRQRKIAAAEERELESDRARVLSMMDRKKG